MKNQKTEHKVVKQSQKQAGIKAVKTGIKAGMKLPTQAQPIG
ncbi:MAG: hypothetical protein QM487_10880 [Candidatus Marithrix sp.]